MRWKDSPRAVLFALLVIHVLAHIDRNMLLGFSPQITQDLALSNAQYGFLAGAVWVLSFGVMALFMGTPGRPLQPHPRDGRRHPDLERVHRGLGRRRRISSRWWPRASSSPPAKPRWCRRPSRC